MAKLGLPGGNLPTPGDAVGSYRVERELARGGLGAVFVAQDARGERVALKVLLHPERSGGLERFRREARVGMTFRHEGLCPVLQFGDHAGMAYLTMPFFEGALPITDYADAEGLGQPERVRLLLQALDAIEAAHQTQAVHRDLKPGNVLVTPQGQVKIVDFGLARQEGQDRLTETGQVLGTAHYMAPEQVKGEAVRADERSDVFSMGVLLYELLAGERPFEAATSVAVMAKIVSAKTPDSSSVMDAGLAGLSGVIDVALAKDPAQRYASAASFAADVRAVLDGRPLSLLASRELRRHRKTRRFLVGAVLLGVAAGGAAGLILPGRTGQPETGELALRAEELGAKVGRRLTRRRSLSDRPPNAEWAAELARLEAMAGAQRPPSLLLARARVLTLEGLAALARGDLATAKEDLQGVPDGEGRAEVLRGALESAIAAVTTEADHARAAQRLDRALEAGLRLPELRGWRAQALVRAGLETPSQVEEALAALLALARIRPLSSGERLDLGRIYLHRWDVKRATETLAATTEWPKDVAQALVLAQTQLDLNHDDANGALARLERLPSPILCLEERRESIRLLALQRARVFLPAVKERSISPAEVERLFAELRLARAVRPEVPLPKELLEVLVTAAEDAHGLDYRLAVGLVKLSPDDYEIQRAMAVLAVRQSTSKEHRLLLLPAIRRALELAPREDREELWVALVGTLYDVGQYEAALQETERILPRVSNASAREAILLDGARAALALARLQRAEELIDEVLALRPGHPKARFHRARLRWQQGRLEEGYADALAFAISGVDGGGWYHATAVAWLWDYGRPRGRQADVRMAIETYLQGRPDDPGGWAVRAACLQLEAGEPELAAESMEAAASTFRRHAEAQVKALSEEAAALAQAIRQRGAGAQAELDALAATLDRLRGKQHHP